MATRMILQRQRRIARNLRAPVTGTQARTHRVILPMKIKSSKPVRSKLPSATVGPSPADENSSPRPRRLGLLEGVVTLQPDFEKRGMLTDDELEKLGWL